MTDYLGNETKFNVKDPQTGEYNLILKVILRKCKQGEIFIESKSICFKCPKEKYSLNTKDKECSPCPLHAKCEGGNN